jgi:hypothetical protein
MSPARQANSFIETSNIEPENALSVNGRRQRSSPQKPAPTGHGPQLYSRFPTPAWHALIPRGLLVQMNVNARSPFELRRINNETLYYFAGSSVRDDGLG